MSFVSSIRSIVGDSVSSIFGTDRKPASTKTAVVAASTLLSTASAISYCEPYRYLRDNQTFYLFDPRGDAYCNQLGKLLEGGACGLSRDNTSLVPKCWTGIVSCIWRGPEGAVFNASTDACISSLYDQITTRPEQSLAPLWWTLGAVGAGTIIVVAAMTGLTLWTKHRELALLSKHRETAQPTMPQEDTPLQLPQPTVPKEKTPLQPSSSEIELEKVVQ